jgi:hypothetical protein
VESSSLRSVKSQIKTLNPFLLEKIVFGSHVQIAGGVMQYGFGVVLLLEAIDGLILTRVHPQTRYLADDDHVTWRYIVCPGA